MKPKVAIFHSAIFESPNLAELRQQFSEIAEISYQTFLLDSPEHLKQSAPDANIIIMNDVALRFEDLRDLPHLQMVSLLGSGYDMIDLDGMKQGGVTVCNAPTYGIENVAQHAISLMFELAHRTGTQNQAVLESGWNEARPDCISNFPIMEFSGKTLGLVGYGNTAHRVKEMLSGFGMKCISASSRSTEDLAAQGVQKVSLDQLFAESDLVSVHSRSTPSNKQFLNADLFNQMKPTSLFINTARGELVNEADLAAALANGKLAGAGLDVLTNEPPLADCPLLNLANCIHTPHIAWNSLAARERMSRESFENAKAFLSGETQNQVN